MYNCYMYVLLIPWIFLYLEIVLDIYFYSILYLYQKKFVFHIL